MQRIETPTQYQVLGVTVASAVYVAASCFPVECGRHLVGAQQGAHDGWPRFPAGDRASDLLFQCWLQGICEFHGWLSEVSAVSRRA
jgi:hypothetical protein